MKISMTVIILGVIVILSGIIFHLQGQAVIGPESSFMYSNPEWMDYGLQIAITGVFLIGIGISVKIFKKR